MENKNRIINLNGSISTLRLGLVIYVAAVLCLTVCVGICYAAEDPIQTVNNLSNFIFSLIRALGLILLGLDIMQVSLLLKSHDPSQRTNGFLTLVGGIIISFTKGILYMIVG